MKIVLSRSLLSSEIMSSVQYRPSQTDIPRLKEPFGTLIRGEPKKTMPEFKAHIMKNHPIRITAVGDIVSRETLSAEIHVDLRIVDQITMRKPTEPMSWNARKTYHVRNPAGVITQESWETIKHAMKERDVLIRVDGEEDLLTLPCIVESPDNGVVLYGQPKEGLVVVDVNPSIKNEARLILGRMTRETVD